MRPYNTWVSALAAIVKSIANLQHSKLEDEYLIIFFLHPSADTTLDKILVS